MTRKAELFGRLALILLSLGIALVAGEILVRSMAPQQLVRSYAAPDPELGRVFRPNQSYFDDNSSFYSYHVRTNGHGMRMDEEVDLSPDRRKVVMLGDSFTFGWGVEVEKCFAQILKESAERRFPSLQLLNTGVGAYSTGHVYRRLEVLHGQLEIGAAIYFMNSNDLADNVNSNASYRIATYDIHQGGTVELHDVKVFTPFKRFLLTRTPYTWLNQHSHSFILAKTAISGIARNKSPDSEARFGIDPTTITKKRADIMRKVSLAHLKRFRDFCRNNEIPFLVLWISSPEEIYDGPQPVFEDFKRDVLNDRESPDSGDWFFDPTGTMRDLLSGRDVEYTHFPEGHFNERGYGTYAQAIEDRVLRFLRSNAAQPEIPPQPGL